MGAERSIDIGRRGDGPRPHVGRTASATAGLAHIPTQVLRRERAQRWSRLLSIAALVVLGLSPVFLHHVARAAAVLWSGADQIGAASLASWRARLTPVHWTFHAVLVAGILYAGWDRYRAWHRARRTLRCVGAEQPTPGDAFWRAARDANVDPAIVRVVVGLPIPAFTIGWRSPRIYVAAELAERLSFRELAAVLAHEGAHVARRDPLLLSLLRFVERALVWLPTVRQLAADVADDIEIRADDAAAGQHPLVLASALLAVARWTPEERLSEALAPAGMAGIACGGLLDRRVLRLAGDAPMPRTHVTRRSILAAAATLMLLWASGVVVAHPGHGHDDNANDDRAGLMHTGRSTHERARGIIRVPRRPARQRVASDVPAT